MITEIVILLEVTEAQKIVLNDKMIHIVKSLSTEIGDRPTDPIYMCVPGTLKDSFDASFSNFVRKKRTYVRHCKHCINLLSELELFFRWISYVTHSVNDVLGLHDFSKLRQ